MNELRQALAEAWLAQPPEERLCFGVVTTLGRGNATVFWWRNSLNGTSGRLGQVTPAHLVSGTLALLEQLHCLRECERPKRPARVLNQNMKRRKTA